MTAQRATLLAIIVIAASMWSDLGFAAADREKLLGDPGVYGTFAAYTLNEDWAKRDGPTRIALLSVLKGVVEQHREKIAIDLYLLRGLSDHADILFRAHANELRDIQKFLLDLQASPFGKHLTVAGIMHGLTKKANYVPGFPDDIKADLKTASDPGPKPYAAVIPIRKSADWWALDQDSRAAMMKESVILGLSLWTASPEDMRSIHAALAAGLASGTLRPVIGRELPLKDATAAHVAVLEPGAYGKIVLVP